VRDDACCVRIAGQAFSDALPVGFGQFAVDER
jgi:hypothetical protein